MAGYAQLRAYPNMAHRILNYCSSALIINNPDTQSNRPQDQTGT